MLSRGYSPSSSSALLILSAILNPVSIVRAMKPLSGSVFSNEFVVGQFLQTGPLLLILASWR